jgi:putative transposase
VLNLSRSAYYAWEKRPKSAREIENEELVEQIKKIYKNKNRTYGCRKMTQELRRAGKVVNHKRIERTMKKEGISSKVAKKFKATTNSKYNIPVAENLLNRDFTAIKPNQKMVSDINIYGQMKAGCMLPV